MRVSCWTVVALVGLAACSGGSPGVGSGTGGQGGDTGSGGAPGGSGGNGGTSGMSGSGGTVVGPNGLAINSFTVTPTELPMGGGPVTLNWSVTGADQIAIDQGVGMVSGTSAMHAVTATTTFTLTATNAEGTITKSARVTVGPASKRPVILSFSAMPASLPMGGGKTTLGWKVTGAQSLSIDKGVGAVTGDSREVTATATTIYTLTATNADGDTTATAAVSVGQNPASRGDLRYSSMMSPTNGESFTAPATLRLIAAGRDGNIGTNSPSPGLGGNASRVQFFVDDQMVAEVAGSSAEYWIFKASAAGIAAGQHRVWARSIYVNPADVLDSEPSLITVAAAPAYERTVTLDADVVIGAEGYELVGTADRRIRLNGNGKRITAAASSAGKLTLKYVDVFDVGSRTTLNQAGIDVTTTGAVTIEDSTIDTSNTVALTLNGTATASIRRNLFRSNMRNPIGQGPDSAGTGPSFPAVRFGGASTGAKVFAGNNVAAGWASFQSVKSWVVGGDLDEDSNILIGPRVGIHVQKSSNIQVRRNFSHHVYNGGWSQGNNFELNESPMMTVEHNIIYGSSWPVRGVACEFRYNLVARSGHQWLWADSSNGFIHHNVFAGGNSDIAGIFVIYNPQNVRIWNNTIDGMLDKDMVTAIKVQPGTATVSLKSNAFINVPKAPTVGIDGGTVTADYNAFGNPQTKNYSDSRMPAHDLGAAGAQVDPKFANPAKVPFDLDEAAIWKRTTTVRDALMQYRARYLPQAGSPLIDAGDPEGGAGNDIGAVGAGAASATDKFGLF